MNLHLNNNSRRVQKLAKQVRCSKWLRSQVSLNCLMRCVKLLMELYSLGLYKELQFEQLHWQVI